MDLSRNGHVDSVEGQHFMNLSGYGQTHEELDGIFYHLTRLFFINLNYYYFLNQ